MNIWLFLPWLQYISECSFHLLVELCENEMADSRLINSNVISLTGLSWWENDHIRGGNF